MVEGWGGGGLFDEGTVGVEVGESLEDDLGVGKGSLSLLEIVGIAGKFPVGGVGDLVFDGVAVDVTAEVQEVVVTVDLAGLEGALEEGADSVVFFVDGFGVGKAEFSHGLGKFAGLEVDEEVVVVGDETVGDEVDVLGVDEVVAEFVEEVDVVVSLEEDGLAVVSSVVDVVVLAGDEGGFARGHGGLEVVLLILMVFRARNRVSPRHPVSSIRPRFIQMWLGWLVGARHPVFLETPGVEWVAGIRPGFMRMWLGWLVGANELLGNRVSPRHPVSSIRARFMQMWLGWLVGARHSVFLETPGV